ncbi:uncharacterized protein SOCE836_040820 [Sorangium cellulosum]|uniref:Uncharacterized protein n=1 Tax=Sorangium cellulosum TaxID=56 RepID=A0A4P2QP64_SORCE|nr:uncharacterized protein SOCE836_040820 [Sorangium cellulosum]WCQ91321.1 hypothetical protein NQZ70_04037 [Sorangium sp. Soce836]
MNVDTYDVKDVAGRIVEDLKTRSCCGWKSLNLGLTDLKEFVNFCFVFRLPVLDHGVT